MRKKSPKSIILLIIIVFISVTFAGCRKTDSTFSQDGAENGMREIEYIELDSLDNDLDVAEFSLSPDQFITPQIAEPITTRQSAVQFGEEILENYPRKGDYVLSAVAFYSQDNVWRFEYFPSQADSDTFDGGLYIMVEGSSGRIIKAWVEE